MRQRMKRAVAAIAGTLAITLFTLAPSPARASCIDPAACICTGVAADGVLTVKVTQVGDLDFTATVESVDVASGKTVSISEGDSVTMSIKDVAARAPEAGDELLVAVSGDQLTPGIYVDSDGHVTCQYQTDYRPTTDHAVALMMSDTCNSDAREEMGPVECNDTPGGIHGCSLSGVEGGSGSAAGWSAFGVLGLALLAAKRRRRT